MRHHISTSDDKQDNKSVAGPTSLDKTHSLMCKNYKVMEPEGWNQSLGISARSGIEGSVEIVTQGT